MIHQRPTEYASHYSRISIIDISRYVTFDEDSTYFKYRRLLIQEVEELKETRVWDMEIGEEILEDHEDHDMA